MVKFPFHSPSIAVVMIKSAFLCLIFVLFTGIPSSVQDTPSREEDITYRKELSQYGITWTFDQPVKSGQFITGDWWVVGPVKIINITPAPGPIDNDESEIKVNRWNDTSLKTDHRMRNGSMIVLEAGTAH